MIFSPLFVFLIEESGVLFGADELLHKLVIPSPPSLKRKSTCTQEKSDILLFFWFRDTHRTTGGDTTRKKWCGITRSFFQASLLPFLDFFSTFFYSASTHVRRLFYQLNNKNKNWRRGKKEKRPKKLHPSDPSGSSKTKGRPQKKTSRKKIWKVDEIKRLLE